MKIRKRELQKAGLKQWVENHRDIHECEDRRVRLQGAISQGAAGAGPNYEGSQEAVYGLETKAQHTASSFKKFAEKKGKFRGEIFNGMWEKEKVLSE